MPTIGICSDAFEQMARARASALGLEDPLLAVCAHPIGGITAEELDERVEQLFGQIVVLLTV